MRKPARNSYIVSARRPDSNLDAALSGPLLRLLCHHARMLANRSVSREGELPQNMLTVVLGGRKRIGYISSMFFLQKASSRHSSLNHANPGVHKSKHLVEAQGQF